MLFAANAAVGRPNAEVIAERSRDSPDMDRVWVKLAEQLEREQAGKKAPRGYRAGSPPAEGERKLPAPTARILRRALSASSAALHSAPSPAAPPPARRSATVSIPFPSPAVFRQHTAAPEASAAALGGKSSPCASPCDSPKSPSGSIAQRLNGWLYGRRRSQFWESAVETNRAVEDDHRGSCEPGTAVAESPIVTKVSAVMEAWKLTRF
ncbi:unnamed protein product [Closterium sp. NIES-64]|nr:unnamed protein product [Closterium sp. NIES-64]